MNAVLPKLLFIEFHSASEFRAYLDATIAPSALSAVQESGDHESYVEGYGCLGHMESIVQWGYDGCYNLMVVPVVTQFFQSLIALQEMPGWINVVYQTKHMFVMFGSLAAPSLC